MWFSPPGNQDYRSLVASMANPVRRAENPKNLRYRDFVDKGYVIAGSPATVRDRLKEEVIKGLHVGNLMVLLQIGSMPTSWRSRTSSSSAARCCRVCARSGTTRAG